MELCVVGGDCFGVLRPRGSSRGFRCGTGRVRMGQQPASGFEKPPGIFISTNNYVSISELG